MIDIQKMEKQLKLEEEMRGLGILKYRRDVEKAKARGQETTTAYGVSLLAEAVEPTAQKIREIIKDHGSRSASKQGIAYPVLKQLAPEVLAFLVIKSTLDTISLDKPYVGACIGVAKLVEDEILHRRFQREHRLLFRSMKKSFRERNAGETYQRQVVRLLARRKGVEMLEWNANLRVNIGTVLIGCMVEATGLVSINQRFVRGRTDTYIAATQKTLDWINGKNAFCELISPTVLPCVVPPKEWSNLYNGGFYTDISRERMVKTRDKKYLKKLEAAEMPEVYQAVNIMQNTAWAINKKVLGVIREMVDTDVTLGLLPKAGPPELPEKPVDIATNEEAKKAWKASAREAYNLHTKTVSKRLSLVKQLWVADKFAAEDELYFVYTLDFRGRVYPVQLFLHPQGDDISRALLTFSKAKPLGNDGSCWLAIHGANLFGFDKASLQARIDWALENQEKIVSCAEDPLANRWWTEADKPFMFLAFCFEWKGYVEEGQDYECALPVSMDGSCNGLQNFSAMLLDEVGGAAVNLVPAAEPNDVYGLVATKIEKAFEEDNDPRAMWWRGKVTRSICKRPVMTLPYGVTKIGMIEQVHEELVKKKQAGALDEDYRELGLNANYFGRALYDVVGETLVAAVRVMDWLKAVAEAHTKLGKPIEWVAPNGFPVSQAYYKSRKTQVKVKSSTIKVRPQIQIYINQIDAKQQKNGISPNFVHSMDAAHMMKTVILAHYNDISHFAMVHDSFGTHAADAALLGMCLRQSFVDMYRSHDVIQEAYERWGTAYSGEAEVLIPPPPAKGKLNLDLILESEFFFA